ncbi:cadherin-23 [Aix galericulata]|nr:cadherin-23 [Aix galericulata]
MMRCPREGASPPVSSKEQLAHGGWLQAGWIWATDNDVGTYGKVSYFFSDDPDRFSLDKDTGVILLTARLDFETTQRYTLTIIARDGGGEETAGRARINVLDVNDNVPTFQKEAYLGALRENEPSVTQVVRLRASDEDSPPNNQITYSIVQASAFREYFDITVSEGYGVISVNHPLDYEQVANGVIYLTVMAKDAGNPPLNSTVPVTIEVFDENDNPPTFSKPSYVIAVMEDIMAGATVLFLNATDLDRSREYGQESIIYSLEGSSHFRINARSGEITTTSLLDREAKSEYILIVRAVDGGVGHHQKTGIAMVNITLLDINDNYPTWKDEPYFINLVEMTPPNSDVTTVVAVDPDLGENGTVVYSIRPPNKFYSLNSTSGKIRTSGVLLDRENPNPQEAELMRRIVVSVTDCGRPPLRATSSATVFVNLLDLNDNDPTFQNLPFAAEIAEGLPAGTSVFQVVAIDLDEGPNGRVTYRMQVGMPRMDFLINSTSGLVTSTAVLDRERIAEYYLRVVASDAGAPSKSSTSTLTVKVLDVNDESPTFFPAVYNVSLPEDVARDFKVVRLNCTDADVGLNAELSYFITGGNQDGKFSVGFRDGVVRTVVSLDRETVASYALILEAIDNGPTGNRRTGTATVFVTVLDVNDNRPIFLQSSYEASVPEDIPAASSIVQARGSPFPREDLSPKDFTPCFSSLAKVKATDADEGVNGRVWYRIVRGKSSSTWGWAGCSWSHLGAARSTFGAAGGPHRCLFLAPPVGNEHHNFRINPSSGLVMRGLRPLDREQNSSHVLEVEAYNTEQGPMRSSVRVRSPGRGWGCSRQPPGVLRQPAGISSPCRAEAGAQEARETWHGNADGKSPAAGRGGLGIINCPGITGDGFVGRGRGPGGLCRAGLVLLRIHRALSPHFFGGVLQVIVYVEDVNDEVPVFTQRQYNRLGLRETAGIGTSVAVVRATDRDTGRELGTGPKTAWDGLILGGPAPVGCSVQTHHAPAPGNGGLVSYKILSGAEGKFEIDESTGLITTIDYLDYETKTSYLMNVSATDQAPPNNQGFCSVYVSLLNELDEAVQFSNSSYEAVIVENIPLGSEVLRVQARSIDNLNQITYKFDPNTNAQALSLFKINGVTVSGLPQRGLPRLGWPPQALGEVVDVALRPRQGVITVKGQVDREKGDFYTLTVVADDGGPKVDSTVRAARGAQAGTGGWAGTDRNQKRASLGHLGHRGAAAPGFKYPHHSRVGRLLLVLPAIWGGRLGWRRDSPGFPGPALTLPCPQVTITVLDENDNSPQFDITSDSAISVAEDSPVGRRVAVVLARDPDAGSNGQVGRWCHFPVAPSWSFPLLCVPVTFSLTAGNVGRAFEIRTTNNTYGEVLVARPLDRELLDRYTLRIQASDGGVPPRRKEHTLRVTVLDVNDNPPVIESPFGYNVSVSENVGGGTAVVQVRATDRDAGLNSVLSYYITRGNEDLTFRMDRVTGEIATRPSPPDRERQSSYCLLVTVEDEGNPSLSVSHQDTRFGASGLSFGVLSAEGGGGSAGKVWGGCWMHHAWLCGDAVGVW